MGGEYYEDYVPCTGDGIADVLRIGGAALKPTKSGPGTWHRGERPDRVRAERVLLSTRSASGGALGLRRGCVLRPLCRAGELRQARLALRLVVAVNAQAAGSACCKRSWG
jgi:hypothetical protein